MDNNLPDIKASEIVQEDLSSKEKLTQSYLLLKKKIFGTDELTRKYNDKQKECERLKTDLDTTTKVAKKATFNYNSTLAKVIKLELLNTKYKKNIESLTEQSNEQKIKTAADQQHIQQLICKIEDLKKNEDDKIIQYDLEKSSLQEKVKELEQELKTVKKSYDTKIKKIEKKIPTEHDNKPKVKEIGINTELTRDEIRQKPKTAEKCVVTDETYNVKEDVYPVFCGKCEVLLEPPPHEKICKIMTNSCPKLIEKISSPKKVSTPLGRSREINSNNYKLENLPTLPNTSPHLHNQNNHSNFIPQNLLTPPTPVSSNPPNYCNNFMPPLPNLMSPGTYIGSTPVISVPLTNLNAINQNNQSESIAAVASSLSIISSLHKKIDTLETKLEMLSKVKSKRSNSCCQHQHQTTCTHDMNSSMQFNFMEMWKRMADLYENKDKKKERFDTHKRNSKQLNNHKMIRLTPKKRLQNTHTNSWKVESAAKKVEQSPSRKRLKKRKGRYSLFSKVDISSNNSEDLENSNSDSDTNSYTDVFGNTTISQTNSNIESKHLPCTETSKSIIISNNDLNNVLKATTSSIHSTDIDEAETIETIRDSVEFSKSMGGETDSGILSDSVESSKLMPLEADTNTFLEYENTTKIKSSIENRSHPNKNIKPVVKSKLSNRPSIKTVLHLTKFNELTETSTGLKPPSQPNKCNGNTEDKEITEAAHDDVIAQDNVCTSTATSSVRKRKRKTSEFQEQKNCNKRAKLLKKLRSLRRNSKCINNTSQNISNHQNVLNHKDEDSRSSKEQTNLDHDTSITKTEDYVPKKRPRIAHVPKSTTDHTSSPNSSLQVKKCLVKNIEERKIELQTISANNEVPNTTAVQTKMQKYDITLNELSETNNELQETNDDGTNQLKSTSVNIINSSIEDSVESNKDETITSDIKNVSNESEIKNSSNVGIHNYNHSNITDESYVNDLEGVYNYDHSNTIIESDIKDSVNETMDTEVESNNQCEVFQSLEQKIENSVQESECINEQTSTLFQQDLNDCQSFKEKSCNEFDLHSTLNKSGDSMKILDIPTPKSDTDTCNEDVTEECSINVQDSIMKEKNTQRVKRNISTKKSNKQCKFIKVESIDPLQKLRQYINKNKSQRTCNQNKELSAVRLLTDKFVKRQLQRLIDNDWGISVHCDVIEKLKSVGSSRIIAKEIVEFLSTISEGQPLDKTHTPPAPLMTKNQQKIVTLLVDLEEWDPLIFQLVLAGIEYKLFRLNSDTVVTKTAIESFARMYTILARIKKDREKVRIFCCDALYCLGLNAILVLYTVFTCWPEVFPNNETSNQLLPKCIAHFIMRQQGTDYPKLNALKNLVSVFYKYPSETLSKDLLNELLTTLQEKSHVEVETAIILLGKREGTTWAYKNIIRSALLPMIINNKLPSEYRGLCLLGNLMRVFPLEDKDNSVSETVEQLCDLIKAGSEESSELNEGVISALLSLSRHKFDKVVENTLTWKPAKPLCDRTEKQFNGLFNQRSLDFWNNYLRKNKLLFGKRRGY